jgi:WD40 repeat protein
MRRFRSEPQREPLVPLARAAGLCAALLLLALPGRSPAQPPEEPAAEKEAAETVEELQSKVSLGLNTGGHAYPIRTMVFTPDGKKLLTARRIEVRLWDVESGREERVWRLPISVNCLAVSPDGKTVAAAGKTQVDADGKPKAPVWLLSPETGAARVIHPGLDYAVNTLAFAPDGTRLACGDGPLASVYDLKARARTHLIRHETGTVERVGFSPDGRQLLVARAHTEAPTCTVWDVSPSRDGKLLKLTTPAFVLDKSDDHWVAWSATAPTPFVLLRPHKKPVLTTWSAAGKLERTFDQAALEKEFGGAAIGWDAGGLYFLPDGRVLAVVARWHDRTGERQSATAVALDSQSGKREQLYRGPVQASEWFTAALSADGKLLALTGDPGSEVILWDVAAKKEVRRLGSAVPTPRFVGWGPDSRTIAWGVELPERKPRVAALTAGLDLATLEPLPGEDLFDLRPGHWNPGRWGVESVRGDERRDKKDGVVLRPPGGEPIETPVHGWSNHFTFYKDSKSGENRVVIGVGRKVYLFDPKANKVLATLDLSSATQVDDVAVSPDNKYLLVAWGQQVLQVFNIEDKPERLLNILVAGPDWVAWTPQGYYAATPGGEKLVGWQVKRDDDSPLAFYPVERFRKLYYKPEIIKQILARGIARVRGTDVEEVLPPVVEAKAEQVGSKVKVQAAARAAAVSQPVLSLRLLLDGRPCPGAGTQEFLPRGRDNAAASWEVEVPPGNHELKILARCPDIAGISEALAVRTPLPDKDRPVLYRVCVGINDYDQKGLHLASARQDAEAVFDALEQCCTGPKNRFRAARGKPLLDKDATRQAVRDALKEVRAQGARPGDLLVMFFAGHGVVQGREFYLLTREADTDKRLAGQSLSGEDLRQAFSDLPCSVLLLMDACHSAAGVRSLRFKPATDDLTRALTDDQVAVTVLAAAMGYETAGELPGKHGLFTQALLDGLKASKDVPFDRYDHLLYVHHLYSHVFSEVRRASQGKQNPFLNMPWTVPPLALRQIPER